MKKTILFLTILSLLGFLILRPPITDAAAIIPWPAPPYFPTNVNFNTSGNQTLVAAPTAFATCVYGLSLTNANTTTSTTINVYQDGGTISVNSVPLIPGGNAYWALNTTNPKAPYFITNTTTAFVISSSNAVQINGVIYSANCP